MKFIQEYELQEEVAKEYMAWRFNCLPGFQVFKVKWKGTNNDQKIRIHPIYKGYGSKVMRKICLQISVWFISTLGRPMVIKSGQDIVTLRIPISAGFIPRNRCIIEEHQSIVPNQYHIVGR